MRLATRSLVLVCLAVLSLSATARAADAATSPQAKAYMAMMKTVQAGDFEGYRKAHTKETIAKMDQQNKEMKLDPKKMMDFMKEASAKDLKFTDVKVDGKKATLKATGKIGGEANVGEILLEDEGGQWKVATESWSNKK